MYYHLSENFFFVSIPRKWPRPPIVRWSGDGVFWDPTLSCASCLPSVPLLTYGVGAVVVVVVLVVVDVVDLEFGGALGRSLDGLPVCSRF